MRRRAVTGYHFMAAGLDGKPVLRDGRPCPAKGETLTHPGALDMCRAGLHASRRAIDALGYAPGPWVARVRLSGTVAEQGDKAVATERTITAGPIDATGLLREFAAACAYRALERYGGTLTAKQMDACLWAADIAAAIAGGADVPNEERAAAGDAARAAAWDAARAAAGDAARAAAWAAAGDAAGAAAWDAAWAAAGAAAWAAAWAAAGAAARDAAGDAAWAAAGAAARDEQNAELERMLSEAGL